MRLVHLVEFEHRLAGDARVHAADLALRFRDQFAQPHHGVGVLLLRARVRRDEKEPAMVERDVNLLVRLRAVAKQRRHARRRWRARSQHRIRRLLEDAPQRRQRGHERIILGIGLALGRAELRVHELEQRRQIRRHRELLHERLELRQRFAQLQQILFRHEQQRLRTHQLQVALVKNIGEQVRLRLEPRPEPLDELPVLLRPLALDDHDEIVLAGELLFEIEKIAVVLFVRAHQVIAARGKIQPQRRVRHARDEQQHLRPQKPARMPLHRPRQRRQQTHGH